MIIGVILYLAIAIIMIIAMWKIFVKAGKPGWAVLIPIYNIIVMLEIVGKPTWWIIIILLVPFVKIIFLICMINLLSLSFGKDVGFTIGILLLGIIFIPVLGFGKAEYQGPAAKEAQQA